MVEALWRFSTSRGVVFGCLDLHGLAVNGFRLCSKGVACGGRKSMSKVAQAWCQARTVLSASWIVTGGSSISSSSAGEEIQRSFGILAYGRWVRLVFNLQLRWCHQAGCGVVVQHNQRLDGQEIGRITMFQVLNFLFWNFCLAPMFCALLHCVLLSSLFCSLSFMVFVGETERENGLIGVGFG